MSGSVNLAIIVGNLGSDPEVREAGGTLVANFSVATSERWKDRQGNPQERTEWHRITAWGKLAEIARDYLKKGSKVYVQGKLQTRKYEKDGQTHSSTEVVLQGFNSQLTMLDSRDGGSRDELDDSVPF